MILIMLRSLIIIAAIVLVFMLVKNRLQNKSPARSETGSSSNTVKCLQCDTYIPASEAITSENNHFCCSQHQRDWQADQSRDS